MKQFFILLVLLLIIACEKNEMTSSREKKSFGVIQEVKVQLNTENLLLRKEILHQVFEMNFNELKVQRFDSVLKVLDSNYKKLFPLLIISRKNSFEVYVLPLHSDKSLIFEEINFKQDENLVFYQENYRPGGLTVLVEYQDLELKLNEQNFQKKQIEFHSLSDLKLLNLNSYQKIQLLELNRSVYLPKNTLVKKQKREPGKCFDGEKYHACVCEYEISHPTSSFIFSHFENINFDVNAIDFDFLKLFQKASIEIKKVSGRALNDECASTPTEDVTSKPLWTYAGKLIVSGLDSEEVTIDSSLQINL